MKLLRIQCTGVRGVPDGSYAFTSPQSGAPLDVVIITGGPGTGKTSLLEAIAAIKEATGSYGGPFDPLRFRASSRRGARIVAGWRLSEAERDRAGLDQRDQTVTWELDNGPRANVELGLRRVFSEFSPDPARGKLEYFHAGRALATGGHRAFLKPAREVAAQLRATRAADKYACVLDGLRAVALEEAARTAQGVRESGIALRSATPGVLAPYDKALGAMLPDLRLRDVDPAAGHLSFVRREGAVVGLDELAASERQGVLFALAFPYLGLDGSLVLVDEPELHVHAAHRVRWLQALVGLGRDNQIIVATGSAEIVSAALPGQVLDLSRMVTEAPSMR